VTNADTINLTLNVGNIVIEILKTLDMI